MKRICTVVSIFTLLFTSNTTTLAQYQSKIDSLISILPSMAEDSNKVKVYQSISWNYAGNRTDLETAKSYADSSKWLAEEIGYAKGMGRLGLYYGVIDRYQGRYAQALQHFQGFIEFFEQRGDRKSQASAWFQIAAVQTELGNFDQSLAAHQQVLQIRQQTQNWSAMIPALNGIGIIYKKMGKFKEAIKTYESAIHLNDSLKLGRDLTYIQSNIGNAYLELNEYKQALTAYQQSHNTAKQLDSKSGIANSLYSMGSVYNALEQHQQALKLHREALQLRQDLDRPRDLAISQLNVGYTYSLLKQFELAKSHLTRGLEMTKLLGLKEFERDAYGYLSELYVAQQEYASAYYYREQFHALNDSIFSQENVRQINELQTRYETAQKDQEINLLAQENKIKTQEVQRQASLKKAFIIGGGLVAILAVMLIYILRQRLANQKALALKDQEIRKAHFNQQLSELEMKALRAQMNPHFIFNCMNSINRMILSGNMEGSSRYLTKFAKLIRLILENSEQPTVPLENELAMLEAYMELESLTNKVTIDYKVEVDKEIESDAIMIPAMVLQPFVENAIWHGLMNKSQGQGHIQVKVSEQGDLLKCVIEDNGVGREAALQLKKQTLLKTQSLGLSITRKRLQLMGSDTQEAVQFTDLKDEQHHPLGTRVEVLIPIV